MLLDTEITAVNFAGFGGACVGISEATGREIDIAVNHSPDAIAAHKDNHRQTLHFQEDVYRVDPVKACAGRPVGLAWFSPDCTHHSKAKNGKPKSNRRRGLARVVNRWAKLVRPRVIFLENVEEFADWGPLDESGQPIRARKGETFKAWRRKLRSYGYVVEHKLLVAADFGAPTTRKRLFLVARRDGEPIAWPEPTHGKGRAHPWRTAAEIMDWTLPCPSIFTRKKSLKPATLRRIAIGIVRHVLKNPRPFIVPVTHPRDRRVHGIDEPLRTVTGANRGELALVTPTLMSHYGESIGRSVEEPVPTVTAGGGGHTALVAPTLIQTGYGERDGQAPRALDLHKPLGTIMATGQKHGLVAALITKHYGGVIGHVVERPIGSVTTTDHHALSVAFLDKMYGSARSGADVREPLPTVTASGGHLAQVRAFLEKYARPLPKKTKAVKRGRAKQLGLALDDEMRATAAPWSAPEPFVVVDGELYVIADIGMRMLQPHELLAAQGFPKGYRLTATVTKPNKRGRMITRPLNKGEQVELIGNSVCPPLAEAVVRANFPNRERAAA